MTITTRSNSNTLTLATLSATMLQYISKFYHFTCVSLHRQKMDINSKPSRSRFSNFHQVRGLGSFFFFLFVFPGRDTISPRFQGRPRFHALISARTGYQTKRDGLNFNTVDIHAKLSSRWHGLRAAVAQFSSSPRKSPRSP